MVNAVARLVIGTKTRTLEPNLDKVFGHLSFNRSIKYTFQEFEDREDITKGADVSRCRLLELPAELHNNIYERVLSFKDTICYHTDDNGNIRNNWRPLDDQGPRELRMRLRPLGIAQLNRKIRVETVSMYFAINIFEL